MMGGRLRQIRWVMANRLGFIRGLMEPSVLSVRTPSGFEPLRSRGQTRSQDVTELGARRPMQLPPAPVPDRWGGQGDYPGAGHGGVPGDVQGGCRDESRAASAGVSVP